MARGLPVDGRRGERDAVRYLKQHGYRVLARNFTCPVGEVDVIALREGTLSFIEVKARSGADALPQEAVNSAKQRKIGRVAEYFLRTRRPTCRQFRFDVIAINYLDAGQHRLEHFQDAFEPA